MLSGNSEQRRLRAANTAGEPHYLRLPLQWMPTRWFEHRQVYEYQLALGAGDVAILDLVADRGWALRIAHGGGQPDTERGLFATPHDALMVLVAEFVFSPDCERRMQPGDGAAAAEMSEG